MRDIGKNLKMLREQKGLKQEELAAQLFVTRQTISNYENGRSRPDIETLMKIAQLLDSDINSILYGPPAAEDQLRAKRQLSIALLFSGLFAILWALGLLIWNDQFQRFSFGAAAASWYLADMIFRPLCLLFLGWSLLQIISRLCQAKPLSTPWVPYVRRGLLLVTLTCLVFMLPYLICWIAWFFRNSSQNSVLFYFGQIPFLNRLNYFIIVTLCGGYPFVFFVLGALLWLFGFPAKKQQKADMDILPPHLPPQE